MRRWNFARALGAPAFCAVIGVCAAIEARASVPPYTESEDGRSPAMDNRVQSKMLEKTRDALMSYEIVEERTEELLTRLQKSALGDYAEKAAFLVPVVTGKLQFRYERFDFSYSHSDARANLDYNLDERWKLFVKREREDGDAAESSGVRYSHRF